MSLLTLFSSPKPFVDAHITTIQRNAVHSWTLLPEVEVILLGNETGVARAAHELGVKHIPEVACNSSGTPLISSMFQLARQNSQSDLLCIVNTDMILMPDFLQAARQVMSLREKFVLLSQRWDYDQRTPLDFSEDWVRDLRASVLEMNRLHRPAGSDFFLFPRACYTDVPDFAIGRAGWDNWMIYKARHEKWPVIDGTPSIMIVHQNHDYGHLPGGQAHHTLPETDENIRLAGGQAAIRYTILDSTYRLINGRLARPGFSALRLQRGLELFLRRILFFLPEAQVENVARPRRWKKRIRKLFK
jgi:hypothetical protein